MLIITGKLILPRVTDAVRAVAWIIVALIPTTATWAAPGDGPVLNGAASRKQHAAAGGFDLPLSLEPSAATVEPRQGPAQAIVFVFDKAVTAGVATVTEGTATVGDPTFSGNEMTVPLTGVANRQYVTVAVTRVLAADGGTGGRGSVRIGFLLGDVSQNRVVTLSDLEQVHLQVAQPVTSANYLKDIDVNGTVTVADEALVNAQLTQLLAAPPVPANQPPMVTAGASQTITLPAGATLVGSVSDDGLPASPGTLTLNWSKISGPGAVTFTNATSAVASATFSAFGSYVLRLTANDGALSNFADVTINASSPGTDKMTLTMTGLPAPIDVTDFQNGASNTISRVSGSGVSNFQDASFSGQELATAPLQLAFLAGGSRIATAKLEVRTAGATLLSDWTFNDVQITLFAIGGSMAGVPEVNFSIAYAKVTYRIFNPDGSVASRMCYDIKLKQSC